MPIRPERKHLYPTNWKSEIVPMIRARSGDMCEICGVRNNSIICRTVDKQDWAYLTSDGRLGDIILYVPVTIEGALDGVPH